MSHDRLTEMRRRIHLLASEARGMKSDDAGNIIVELERVEDLLDEAADEIYNLIRSN